jgi:uncharacterized protein
LNSGTPAEPTTTISRLNAGSADPSSPPTSAAGRLLLEAEVPWVVVGSPAVLGEISTLLGGLAQRVTAETLLVTFGNAVGFFDLPGVGPIEVVSRKWGAEQFDAMLQELTEVAAGLPFAAATSPAFPYERSVTTERDVLYHAFVYLRHALVPHTPDERSLAAALRVILHEPHARLDRERHVVPVERAARIDSRSLMDVAAGRFPVVDVAPPSTVQGLRAGRLSFLPLEISEARARRTFDTAENRFVKTFVRMAEAVVDQVERVAASRPMDAFVHRVLRDCWAMRQCLAPVSRHAVWTDVGEMAHIPAGSPVLRARRGYKETYVHFSRLYLSSRVPLSEELSWDLLQAKDIALLYELWCFFVMVRSLGEVLNGPPDLAHTLQVDDLELHASWGLAVEWEGRARLVYNESFSRSKPEAQRTYSVPLRPDITLRIAEGHNRGVHLFDAKFRVDRLAEVMPVGERADDATEERAGVFRRADLYKMHTYRDAIPSAKSVWILYPGTDFRFFHRAHATVAGTSADLPSEPDGVGAVPLVPGNCQSELRGLLRLLVGE